MSSLKTLVEGIVTDLINARFEADVKTAELAEHYRDHPILRSMSVPSLNITNVSVDLRVVFDEEAIDDNPGPSEQQKEAVAEATKTLQANLMGLKSVTDKVTVARQRTALSRSLTTGTVLAAEGALAEPPKIRRQTVEKKITDVLTANQVTLSAADRRKLTAELAKFDAAVAVAPKAQPRVTGIVVGAEALKAVNPELVTSIKFDIDLDETRWTEAVDGTGNTRSVLTDR